MSNINTCKCRKEDVCGTFRKAADCLNDMLPMNAPDFKRVAYWNMIRNHLCKRRDPI